MILLGFRLFFKLDKKHTIDKSLPKLNVILSRDMTVVKCLQIWMLMIVLEVFIGDIFEPGVLNLRYEWPMKLKLFLNFCTIEMLHWCD